jgi:hypothetical protein
MTPVHARAPLAPAGVPPADSLDASDDGDGSPRSPRYCPIELLARFALLMAGRGRCVHTDVMLGDREYAMWQLACASATDDPELAAVVSRLFAYFDDPQHSGIAVMGTA